MTNLVRLPRLCLIALFGLPISGKEAIASDGRIEFTGAIVAPTVDPTRFGSTVGTASTLPAAMTMQRTSLREALNLHAALLDYFSSQVPVDRAAVITLSYD